MASRGGRRVPALSRSSSILTLYALPFHARLRAVDAIWDVRTGSPGASTSPPRLDKSLWGAHEEARYIGLWAKRSREVSCNTPTVLRGGAVGISVGLRGSCSSGRCRSEGCLSRSDRLPPCRR